MSDSYIDDIDDEIVQAYLLFKKKDYNACLSILKDKLEWNDNLSVQHNIHLMGYFQQNIWNWNSISTNLDSVYDKMIKQSQDYQEVSSTNKAICEYNIAVMQSIQQKYDQCEKMVLKILSEYKPLNNTILVRCHFLLIEVYLNLYRVMGETKEWLLKKCLTSFTQIESILSKEPIPDYVKNRLLFRYHVYRSLYFLEQGNVKGVKKEVKTSTDYYLLYANDSNEDYLDYVKSTVNASTFPANSYLDGYENVTKIDGYLPPILKTRLEFRRGNSLKILSVLNQIYEPETEEEASIAPDKDSFYYSMVSSVYYSGGMYQMSKYYLIKALERAEIEKLSGVIGGSLCKNLSIVCILLDQKDEALQWSQEAIQYLPQNPLIWFRYGEINYQLAIDIQKPQNQKGISQNSTTRNEENTNLQHHFYLKNAFDAFSTVIDIFSQRQEFTSSVYYASYLRKACILLELKNYQECAEVCTTLIDALHANTTYENDDLPTSKEDIELVVTLYLAESHMHLGHYNDATCTLLPTNHPQLYPPVIVEVTENPFIFSEKQTDVEKAIIEWSKPYLESYIYNLCLLSIYQQQWETAELYSNILMFFSVSKKNMNLRLYMFLLKGEREKAKQFYDEYMMKCLIVC